MIAFDMGVYLALGWLRLAIPYTSYVVFYHSIATLSYSQVLLFGAPPIVETIGCVVLFPSTCGSLGPPPGDLRKDGFECLAVLGYGGVSLETATQVKHTFD